MSTFLSIDMIEQQPGTFRVEGEDADRSILALRGVIIDESDARRLAAHYAAQRELGRDPLAAECRELAGPIMQALVDAGFASSES